MTLNDLEYFYIKFGFEFAPEEAPNQFESQ